jgi:hypothetical protein
MTRWLPPLLCRVIALFLLVLDLSQEPASALPLTLYGDGDNDTLSEVCTKETFWRGLSEDDQDSCSAATAFVAGTKTSFQPETVVKNGDGRHSVVGIIYSLTKYRTAAEFVMCGAPHAVLCTSARHQRDPTLAALMTVRLLI